MTEHDRFESAYRECFPVASSMQADLFERDDDGYIEAKVHTAFTLWKAARATPSDHIGEAAEKVDAGSDRTLAFIDLLNHYDSTMRNVIALPSGRTQEQKDRGRLALIEAFEAQAPQPEAKSVSVAVWQETDVYWKPLDSFSVDPNAFAYKRPLYAAPQSDAQSVRDAALDEAAIECDRVANQAAKFSLGPQQDCASSLAGNIRALKSAPPQKPVSDEVKP